MFSVECDVISQSVNCCMILVSIHRCVQRIKADIPKDISLAEAGKYGSLTDFAFFDKVGRRL